MTSLSPFALVATFAVSLCAFGCAPPRQACAPDATASAAKTSSSAAAHDEPEPRRSVYRFDFAVTTSEGSGAPSNMSFSLELEEFQKGEVIMGKNVSLATAPFTASAGSPPPPGPRQDVGMKIGATFRTQGPDVLLEVMVESSVFDAPSTIRKLVAKGNALVTPGKATVVTALDDDAKHYRVTVTPTKLR